MTGPAPWRGQPGGCWGGAPPGADAVALGPEHAARLLHLLRDLGRCFEDADGQFAELLDEHFGFAPAADTYAAALEIEVDDLQEALDAYTYPFQAHAG
ncbi:hypothetical protein KDL01_35320 [Actinospica durhamensis]|uniref:Uncharacterized protein n=1 Tax=Actinospica durhamensis TaxID=1508375 RepID=A0A941EUX3_9ACTN|nr:hypothetical protein [Actinospica durhamensis]MBR7838592.1 hypothetical protein [Actinospica durhamensis]